MALLTVEVVTPQRVVSREDVEVVSLPTTRGEISMLPHHTPYLGALAPGAIRFRKEGMETMIAVSGGVVEIHDGQHVKVLANTAEHAAEIDELRAEEARKRAQELQKRVAFDDAAFAHASGAMEKELARIRVARLHRHRGHRGSSRGELQP